MSKEPIIQLYGALTGISFQQQADTGSQDTEPELLQCPNCEVETIPAEHCAYCGFNLVDWALSMTQSNAISETLAEMKLENINYYRNGG